MHHKYVHNITHTSIIKVDCWYVLPLCSKHWNCMEKLCLCEAAAAAAAIVVAHSGTIVVAWHAQNRQQKQQHRAHTKHQRALTLLQLRANLAYWGIYTTVRQESMLVPPKDSSYYALMEGKKEKEFFSSTSTKECVCVCARAKGFKKRRFQGCHSSHHLRFPSCTSSIYSRYIQGRFYIFPIGILYRLRTS